MRIAGILNITEDSFSDGNIYLKPDSALNHALKLHTEGADIIDIGAQSSNPNAAKVPDTLEWERIEPVLHFLKQKKVSISIDTFKPYVIRKSIESGVNFINNILGFTDIESERVLKDFAPVLPELILMYSHSNSPRAIPDSPLQVDTVVEEISRFFEGRIREMNRIGVPLSLLYFDPGMGFFLGENPDLSFKVLASLKILKKRFGKIFVSVSRKSFLGAALGGVPPSERKEATLAVELYLAESGVDILRTHEPLPLLRGIEVRNRIFQHGESF